MISRSFEQVDNLIRNTDDRWSDKAYVTGLRIKSLFAQIFNLFLINSLDLVSECSFESAKNLFRKGKPAVMALWHGDFLSNLYYWRNRELAVVASLSKDGDIITKSLDSLGYQAIRGSSSRGGARVILEAVKLIKKGFSVAFTIDGPKGPVHEVKPGIIKLVQKTGVPIIPMGLAYTNSIKLHNWDSTRIPLPFSKTLIHVGEPLFIDSSISIEKGCEMLKSYMFECEKIAVQKLKAGF
ncbi:MAG: lysophospholipid acyltransferase family protein [Candidatus Riflebacteria bacterium]|nr:lysophospholipid acyltransferase family protein [Candidatus Riflebacteria bacterium]